LLQASPRLVAAESGGRVDAQRLGDILDVGQRRVALIGRNLTIAWICGLRRADWRHIY
jgi:hypothetical protein